MRINKHDIPTVIDAPGAVARQIDGFGEAAEPMAGEYFSLGRRRRHRPAAAGTARRPLRRPALGLPAAGRRRRELRRRQRGDGRHR